MKFSLVLLFVSLFVFPSEGIDNTIEWDENKKLTWADFRGPRTKNGSYVASTSSGISFSYSHMEVNGVIEYDYAIKCHFYPDESWYDETRASDYILKHEQTHFDISELHARMLRKRISEADLSASAKAEIRAFYEAVEVDRRVMQNKFDSESDHSKNKEMEYQWEAYVENQLKAYARFK
jgi:hypothetical protein